MIVDIDLTGLRILIIDDSRYARSFLKSALYSFGARDILEAADGASGIEIMTSQKVDLLLVDHDMEPLNGIELTRFLRTGEIPAVRDLPVVMISGMAEMEKVVKARNAGVSEFLAKPVSAESLFRRVRNALVNPRPFVETAVYCGPCRRTIDRKPPETERREAPPLPKPPPRVKLPKSTAQPTIRKALAPSDKSKQSQGSERTSRKRFKAGAPIFAEGDEGHEAYVVETGRVRIYKIIDGAKVTLGELGPQGIFGEMALIDGEPRMAYAEAADDTVCLIIPKPALKAQINRTPDLVILVLETLLQDIRKMGHELVEVRARLKRRRR